VRELRQLREENSLIKRLVADLTLDKHIMAEIIRETEAGTQARARGVGADGIWHRHLPGVSVGEQLALCERLSLFSLRPGGNG
jgi:hypothetical protein